MSPPIATSGDLAIGVESSGSLPAVLDACLRPSGLPLVLAQNAIVGDLSDHHAFRLRGVPYLFLTCGRWPHYHQSTDTPDKLAWPKIELIRDYVVALARSLATVALLPANAETTAVEIRYLEAALGPLLPAVLAQLGLQSLRTRRNLEHIGRGLRAVGL